MGMLDVEHAHAGDSSATRNRAPVWVFSTFNKTRTRKRYLSINFSDEIADAIDLVTRSGLHSNKSSMIVSAVRDFLDHYLREHDIEVLAENHRKKKDLAKEMNNLEENVKKWPVGYDLLSHETDGALLGALFPHEGPDTEE